MEWDKNTNEKFKLMLSKMPIFHRHMAQSAAGQKAEELAAGRGASQVEEQDLVRALFAGVPKMFANQMMAMMKEVGLNYEPYIDKQA